MAAISERAIPTEDTFQMLRDKASKEENSFMVKVLRRSFQGGVPEMVASLSGATVEHFTSPELWLPALCGGGHFSLQGYHVSDLSKAVGGFLTFKVSSQEPKDIDPSIVSKPDWRGPATLEYPKKEAREQPQASIYDLRPPPAPGDGSQRHQNVQPISRSAGGGFYRSEYDGESSVQERMRLQGALEGERRKLEEERLANERQKHRDELESLKKSHEADMRAFKSEIMGELRAKPADNGTSMIAEMLKAQAEDRREAAKLAAEDRRDRDRLAAEDRRAAEIRQAANDDRFSRLLEKMTDRPKEDPLAMVTKVAELLGKGNSNEAQMKMMHSMTDMMSSQVGVAMDFVQAAADLKLGSQGEGESPIVKGIEAAVKGLGAMARGAQKRPPTPLPPAPPTYEQQALTPPQQPQQQVQQPRPPQAPPAPQAPVPSAIEQIEGAIRRKLAVTMVAKALVDHFNEASIQAALVEAGFDIDALIAKRLGTWPTESAENKAYLEALLAEVEKQATAAGLFAPEGGGEEGEGGGEEQPEEDGE